MLNICTNRNNKQSKNSISISALIILLQLGNCKVVCVYLGGMGSDKQLRNSSRSRQSKTSSD